MVLSRDERLLNRLEECQVGYEAAISAIQFMPAEARPYTERTANEYLLEMAEIRKKLGIN